MIDKNLENRIRSQCKRMDNGCLEWQGGRMSFGYGALWLGGVKGRRYRVHRLMYEIHNGPIPEGLSVLHSCDNPPCCEPTHLRMGTHQENCQDTSLRKRSPRVRRMATRLPKGSTPTPDEIVEHLTSKCYTDFAGCLVWGGSTSPDGYGIINFKGKGARAHRLMYESYNHCKIESWQVIMHTCDNRACIEPTHLKAVSQGENIRDASAKKRTANGESHGRTKLTNEQVIDIVLNHADWLAVDVAKKFNCDRGTVGNIRLGKSWTHVTGNLLKPSQHSGENHWMRKRPDRIARGEKSGPKLHPESYIGLTRKLSASQEEDIVKLVGELTSDRINGMTKIAEQFNITLRTVYNIVKRHKPTKP